MRIQLQLLIDHITTTQELNEYCIIFSLLCSLLLRHDATEDQVADNDTAEDGEDAKANQAAIWPWHFRWVDPCRRKGVVWLQQPQAGRGN